MLIILSLLSLENHISLPKHSLRYSPHIEVIFPLKQFKFWIKEYSKKQVWNKKINVLFLCFFFPPFLFLFPGGESGSSLHVVVFHICSSWSGAVWRPRWVFPCRWKGWERCASGGLTAVLGPAECDDTHPCEGLGRHATFRNFGMAFLTLFRVSTGDNWNGIMKVRDPRKMSIAYNCLIRSCPLCSRLVTMPSQDTHVLQWAGLFICALGKGFNISVPSFQQCDVYHCRLLARSMYSLFYTERAT